MWNPASPNPMNPIDGPLTRALRSVLIVGRGPPVVAEDDVQRHQGLKRMDAFLDQRRHSSR